MVDNPDDDTETVDTLAADRDEAQEEAARLRAKIHDLLINVRFWCDTAHEMQRERDAARARLAAAEALTKDLLRQAHLALDSPSTSQRGRLVAETTKTRAVELLRALRGDAK